MARPDSRTRDHLPNLRPGPAAAAPVVAAPAAARHHPADDRPLPRLRRPRRRRHLGRGHQEGRAGPAGACPGRCGSSPPTRSPTLRAFCDIVLAQDPSPGSRWPRWSTTSSPTAAWTATSTPTCPTTATPGGWCCAGLDHTAPVATRPASPAARRGPAEAIVVAVRAGPAGRRGVGELNVTRAWSV